MKLTSILFLIIAVALIWLYGLIAILALLVFFLYLFVKAYSKNPNGFKSGGSFLRRFIHGCSETIKMNFGNDKDC
jgi:hypothetical protein